MAAVSDTYRQERRDLETLALSSLVIVLLWRAALGWDRSMSIGTHDQVAQTIPLLRDFLSHAGAGFTHFSYRPELLGGAKLHDLIGTPPFFDIAAQLGLGVLDTLNGIAFFTQLVSSFLGVRLAYDLSDTFAGAHVPRTWASRLGIVLVTAFAPVLGMKLTVGHYEVVLGSLAGVALLSLLFAEKNRTVTFTLLAVTALVELNAFQGKGQQLVYVGLFFWLLLLAPVWGRPLRQLLAPASLTAGCVALSLPKLAGMFSHALGGDAGRSLGGESVIYSYITATSHDWLASIPWGLTVIPSHRDLGLLHEINFAFGPPLLLALLLPWRRARVLGLGLALCFVLPLLFSMDVPGVASALTHVFPPLKAFRVPERAMIPFALLLPIVAVVPLLLAERAPRALGPRGATGWAPVAVAGMALYALPPLIREAVAWVIPLALLFGPRFGVSLPTHFPRGALLVVLGCGSLAAFKERLRPYATEASLLVQPIKLAAQMRKVQPDLASPLARIVLHFDLDGFQTNTAYAMGLSSLSGYLNPPRRFVLLEAALSNESPNMLRNYFRLDETAPSFSALQPLYNVKFGAFPEAKGLRLSPLGETAGPAWFTGQLSYVATMADLATALHAVQEGLASKLHERAWVVRSDDAVALAELPETLDPGCRDAVVTATEAAFGEQQVRLTVESHAACPLIVSMNYASDLVATARGERLKVFPIYGALTGVWVPAGTHEIVVAAEPVLPHWSNVAWFLGLGLVGASFIETWRRSRERC